MSNLKLGVEISAELIAHPRIEQKVQIYSLWDWELWRKGVLVEKWRAVNVCTNQGVNKILNVMFNAATQIATWYVCIFEDNYTPQLVDTYAVPGYVECTAYDEATRPEYVEAESTNKSITNSANKATFTMNVAKTIYGGSLVGGGAAPATKGNTAGGGTLFCASQFAAPRAVVDDDILKVTVTVNGADV